IAIIRLSGKRTLSKWNAFDFVVTIALGSTLSTALVSTQVSLAQSITAFLVIVALQFVITFSSVRSRAVKNLIKSQPTLLLFQGQFRQEAMAQERVVEAEVRAAIRENGIADVERVHAVVLETDGTFSVIPDAGGSDSALQGVAGLSSHRA
ncbi:MAG: YetF domain-containing protein, partial [Pseudomonadota bacterium]|nr:YetF domain-containing protein [Pseudomonadota bacterium]